MPVLVDIAQLATCRAEGTQDELHAIPDAALVWRGTDVLWTGARAELPPAYAAEERFSAQHKLVIPGLIDCHTHLAFAGDRVHEFQRRIRGESYLAIAESGGGIAYTVRATRAAAQEELEARCLTTLADMLALGVTSIEAKSGYGLELDSELKLLRVYRSLSARQPIEISATLLAAHTVPVEYRARREAYVALVREQILPQVANEALATFCDVFVEKSAFTLAEARAIFTQAKAHGLGIKIHADQLSAGGGAELAAELQAISASHLEHASDDGLRALAAAGAVAEFLPLAALYTFERPLAARRLLELGLSVAVASDYNPGSAPSYHLPLALLLACTTGRMTPNEALKGATLVAARALGRAARIGSLEPGKQADFALIDAPDVAHWLCHFRGDRALATVKRGALVHGQLARAR